MSVTPLRITAKWLLPRLREAAKASSKVVFVPPLEKRSMAGMIDFHRALKCLHEGSIVGVPKRNHVGHWELRMERGNFSAKVIAVCDGAAVTQLIVCFDQDK